jgi:spore coat polysaccharide biosynthesis protein SpsF (cytidylyltransferase family)
MNLLRDLKKEFQEKKKQESMTAQLRKRSKDSIARPKAEKNITSNDPRLQGI